MTTAAESKSAPAAQSYIHRLLVAKDSLPQLRRLIFEAVYQRGQPRSDVAQMLGMSAEAFEQEHAAMLKSLRFSSVTN